MGRNYFSKHGGPYFINDGLTRHSEPSPKPSNKKDITTFVCVALGILTMLFVLNVVVISSFK